MDNFSKEYRLQQWALMVQEQKQSGLTVKEWCSQNNVTKDAFFYRQHRVRTALAAGVTSGSLPDTPAFAELKPVSGNGSFPSEACIHTAWADIYLNGNASAPLIANILKAMKSC